MPYLSPYNITLLIRIMKYNVTEIAHQHIIYIYIYIYIYLQTEVLSRQQIISVIHINSNTHITHTHMLHKVGIQICSCSNDC